MANINNQIFVEAHFRQDGRCADCGDTNTGLNAHHLKRQADGGSNNLNNIALLCDDCHYAAHNYGHYRQPIQTSAKDYPHFR